MLREAKNYGGLQRVPGIKEAVLGKQLEALEMIYFSIKETMLVAFAFRNIEFFFTLLLIFRYHLDIISIILISIIWLVTFYVLCSLYSLFLDYIEIEITISE